MGDADRELRAQAGLSGAAAMPMLPRRVHVMGASGSGTTTLGRALAAHWGAVHLDADDYYWLPTSPPYRHKRPAAERLARLQGAMTSAARVVVSGSVMGWGDEVEEAFDIAIPDEALGTLKTVGDVVNGVKQLVDAKAGGASAKA